MLASYEIHYIMSQISLVRRHRSIDRHRPVSALLDRVPETAAVLLLQACEQQRLDGGRRSPPPIPGQRGASFMQLRRTCTCACSVNGAARKRGRAGPLDMDHGDRRAVEVIDVSSAKWRDVTSPHHPGTGDSLPNKEQTVRTYGTFSSAHGGFFFFCFCVRHQCLAW